MRSFAIFILSALVVTCASLSVAQAQELKKSGMSAEVQDQGVWIYENVQPVLFFQTQPKSLGRKWTRASYVHPLYDLDGRVLTEDFPSDHRHHRGIFWAWHQIDVGDQRIADGWSLKDIEFETNKRQADSGDGYAELKVEVDWKSPRLRDDDGRPKPFLSETTHVRVYAAEDDARKIDFEIHLHALVKDLRLGGSEDVKGYGGFSTRIVLPEDVRFLGQEGTVVPQRTSVEPSPWMDVTATYGPGGGKSGLAILCHPSLPGFPQRWILRNSRSMQNPVYPGREAVKLSMKEPLMLRYRLVLHRGEVTTRQISTWQEEYVEGKQPASTKR